jgi:hypothetical protein
MRFKYLLIPTFALFAGIVIFLTFWLVFRTQDKFKINRDQAAVVKEMKDLDRLETAQFTIEKIIEAGTNGNEFKQFLFGDKILLIAHGDVIAGFDLSQVKADNIQIDGSTLKVDLPAPQILVVDLDNDQTRVYDRKQGVLTKGNKDLEAEARLAAEQEIQKAACSAHILDQATTNGRKQLTTLFKGLGYTTVILNIPNGSC